MNATGTPEVHLACVVLAAAGLQSRNLEFMQSVVPKMVILEMCGVEFRDYRVPLTPPCLRTPGSHECLLQGMDPLNPACHFIGSIGPFSGAPQTLYYRPLGPLLHRGGMETLSDVRLWALARGNAVTHLHPAKR